MVKLRFAELTAIFLYLRRIGAYNSNETIILLLRMYPINQPATDKRPCLFFRLALLAGKIIPLFCIFYFTSTHLKGQCSPNRTAVWNSILAVIDSPTISYPEKLVILKAGLEKMEHCQYKNDSTHAFLLQIIGEACFNQPDFINSIKYYQQSINIIQANAGKPSVNPARLISNYYWLAVANDSINNIAAKIKAIDSCISISFKLHQASNIYCIRSLYERITWSFNTGDYTRCIESAGLCEQLGRQYLRSVSKSSPEYNTGKAIVESSLGWYVKAQLMILNDFSAAENFLKNKPEEYKSAGMENYLGVIYSELAEIQIQKGDYKKALSYYYTGLNYARQAANNFTCKQIMNNIGHNIYFSLLKDYGKALQCYQTALKYTNTDAKLRRTDIMESLSIYGNMASIYAERASYDSAMKYFQLAFDQLAPGLNENSIYNNKSAQLKDYDKLYYLENLLIDKGDTWLKKNKTDHQPASIHAAINVYKAADYLLDRVREVQSDIESKLFWRNNYRRLYEHAVEACYLQGNYSDAFYFFEKSRAVLLNDQLMEQHLMSSSDIAALIPLKKKVYQLQAALANGQQDTKDNARLQADLFTSKQELEKAGQLIKNRYPLYALSTDTNFNMLAGLKKKVLNNFQSVLEIFSGDSAVYVLLITATGTTFNKIDKNDFDKTVSSYMGYLSDRDVLNQDFTGFRAMSYKLYKLIFHDRLPPGGRIIVSPEGRYFPFESLITDNRSKNPEYFLKDYAITYTYSSRYMMDSIFSATSSARGDFLGVAPVTYNPAFALPSLVGSDVSVTKLGNVISRSENLIGQNASRNNFLQQFPYYKILQLYTHASDSSSKKEPVIYLADSALYLSELNMVNKPVTQLVVLSACKTGAGKLYRGEGVFSFSRGFSSLGIPSAVINLWSVDNISTYEITEHLYKYLHEGLPIDIALQKAKLDFLLTATGEKQLPYYWAPEVLTGKADPVSYRQPIPWKTIVLVSGLLVIAALGIRKFTIKQRNRHSLR